MATIDKDILFYPKVCPAPPPRKRKERLHTEDDETTSSSDEENEPVFASGPRASYKMMQNSNLQYKLAPLNSESSSSACTFRMKSTNSNAGAVGSALQRARALSRESLIDSPKTIINRGSNSDTHFDFQQPLGDDRDPYPVYYCSDIEFQEIDESCEFLDMIGVENRRMAQLDGVVPCRENFAGFNWVCR